MNCMCLEIVGMNRCLLSGLVMGIILGASAPTCGDILVVCNQLFESHVSPQAPIEPNTQPAVL